jgi:Tfp pilus assembly protein PilF
MPTHSSQLRGSPWPSVVHLLFLLLAVTVLPACRSTSPYAPQDEVRRDSLRAQELTQEAARLMDASPTRAEELLREALAADLYHGPAHNNLGVLYLKQSKLYEAAGEFEWAKKLMPGHPDPRMNLALTLERAGRTPEALDAYASALEAVPEHIPTIQALTRLQLRTNQPDERTPAFLDTIALQGDTPEWRQWARLERAKRSP